MRRALLFIMRGHGEYTPVYFEGSVFAHVLYVVLIWLSERSYSLAENVEDQWLKELPE